MNEKRNSTAIERVFVLLGALLFSCAILGQEGNDLELLSHEKVMESVDE